MGLVAGSIGIPAASRWGGVSAWLWRAGYAWGCIAPCIMRTFLAGGPGCWFHWADLTCRLPRDGCQLHPQSRCWSSGLRWRCGCIAVALAGGLPSGRDNQQRFAKKLPSVWRLHAFNCLENIRTERKAMQMHAIAAPTYSGWRLRRPSSWLRTGKIGV